MLYQNRWMSLVMVWNYGKNFITTCKLLKTGYHPYMISLLSWKSMKSLYRKRYEHSIHFGFTYHKRPEKRELLFGKQGYDISWNWGPIHLIQYRELFFIPDASNAWEPWSRVDCIPTMHHWCWSNAEEEQRKIQERPAQPSRRIQKEGQWSCFRVQWKKSFNLAVHCGICSRSHRWIQVSLTFVLKEICSIQVLIFTLFFHFVSFWES